MLTVVPGVGDGPDDPRPAGVALIDELVREGVRHLPTPAGLLLLPVACRSGFGAYPALSAVGWRAETGHVLLPDRPRRSGIWAEGMSQRRDLDQLPMWAYIVAASRDAGLRSGWLDVQPPCHAGAGGGGYIEPAVELRRGRVGWIVG